MNYIEEKSSIWYILEADLEYPDELHELQIDYPLAPENIEISCICFQIIVAVLLKNRT